MSGNISNARDPEQARRMKALFEAGLCYFCLEGSAEEKTLPTAIHEGKHWFVMKNDFPLHGSVHHYLIIPYRHVVNAHELTTNEVVEKLEMEKWLVENLSVSGYSMFVRSGNTTLTGATLDHTHFHFLVGGPRPKRKKVALKHIVPVVLAFKSK